MATEIIMPRLGDFMTEGVVGKWRQPSGQRVNQGDVIAEIESEKLNYELEATDSGIFHLIVDEGATVPVDGLMGYLLAEGEAPPDTSAPARQASSETPPRIETAAAPSTRPTATVAVPSTPGARRLAARLKVDISSITPTGPRGRVVEADVRGYAEKQQAAKAPALPPGLPTPARSVPVERMRKSIADHMRASLANTAQLSFLMEVDVTEAQRMRREASKSSNVTVALAHVIVKACAEALRRVPAINTVLAGGEIHYFDQVNIGVAVSLDDGLIVPVLKNVDQKSIFQIADEAGDLAVKARNGTLLPDDVTGGTFTISVLGIVDGFTPVLNAGQSAILGVGRSVEKPVVRRGEVVAREMVTLSLTTDHQVVDGATAAGFLRRLQQGIERPAHLFK